ncbi:hypothetical protein Pelo_1257 [Pelomyxa schiedti]|nr:hypothetical protein Pelo_1257 [Pelomyxa schiedti]
MQLPPSFPPQVLQVDFIATATATATANSFIKLHHTITIKSTDHGHTVESPTNLFTSTTASIFAAPAAASFSMATAKCSPTGNPPSLFLDLIFFKTQLPVSPSVVVMRPTASTLGLVSPLSLPPPTCPPSITLGSTTNSVNNSPSTKLGINSAGIGTASLVHQPPPPLPSPAESGPSASIWQLQQEIQKQIQQELQQSQPGQPQSQLLNQLQAWQQQLQAQVQQQSRQSQNILSGPPPQLAQEHNNFYRNDLETLEDYEFAPKKPVETEDDSDDDSDPNAVFSYESGDTASKWSCWRNYYRKGIGWRWDWLALQCIELERIPVVRETEELQTGCSPGQSTISKFSLSKDNRFDTSQEEQKVDSAKIFTREATTSSIINTPSTLYYEVVCNRDSCAPAINHTPPTSAPSQKSQKQSTPTSTPTPTPSTASRVQDKPQPPVSTPIHPVHRHHRGRPPPLIIQAQRQLPPTAPPISSEKPVPPASAPSTSEANTGSILNLDTVDGIEDFLDASEAPVHSPEESPAPPSPSWGRGGKHVSASYPPYPTSTAPSRPQRSQRPRARLRYDAIYDYDDDDELVDEEAVLRDEEYEENIPQPPRRQQPHRKHKATTPQDFDTRGSILIPIHCLPALETSTSEPTTTGKIFTPGWRVVNPSPSGGFVVKLEGSVLVKKDKEDWHPNPLYNRHNNVISDDDYDDGSGSGPLLNSKELTSGETLSSCPTPTSEDNAQQPTAKRPRVDSRNSQIESISSNAESPESRPSSSHLCDGVRLIQQVKSETHSTLSPKDSPAKVQSSKSTSSDEDTSDEAYALRHKKQEALERERFIMIQQSLLQSSKPQSHKKKAKDQTSKIKKEGSLRGAPARDTPPTRGRRRGRIPGVKSRRKRNSDDDEEWDSSEDGGVPQAQQQVQQQHPQPQSICAVDEAAYQSDGEDDEEAFIDDDENGDENENGDEDVNGDGDGEVDGDEELGSYPSSLCNTPSVEETGTTPTPPIAAIATSILSMHHLESINSLSSGFNWLRA